MKILAALAQRNALKKEYQKMRVQDVKMLQIAGYHANNTINIHCTFSGSWSA